MMEIIVELGNVGIAEDVEFFQLIKGVNYGESVEKLGDHLKRELENTPNQFFIVAKVGNNPNDLEENVESEDFVGNIIHHITLLLLNLLCLSILFLIPLPFRVSS